MGVIWSKYEIRFLAVFMKIANFESKKVTV